MKMLIAFIFALAVGAPVPPGNLSVDAAIRIKAPECSYGNGIDANGDGVIDTGCPPADQSTAITGGRAVETNSCKISGTLVSTADGAASDATVIENPSTADEFKGQIGCYISAPAGTKTLWIRASTPISGKTRAWFRTTTPFADVPLVTDIPVNLFNGGQILTPTWFNTNFTFTGTTVALFALIQPGIKIDCFAWTDTVAGFKADCPGAVTPENPEYVVLNTATLPSGVTDLIWGGANNVPLTGTDTGMTSSPIVKILWNSASNKFCMYQQLTAANLLATTTADDDSNISVDSALLMDWRNDRIPTADLNTYRFYINGNASPAKFDGNWPGGGLTSAFNLSTVTPSQSYDGTTMRMMMCAVAPSTIVANSLTYTNYSARENVNGLFNEKRAKGAGTFPIATDATGWFLTKWDSTNATPLTDTTPPTVGASSFVNVGNTSMDVRASVVDNESGITSAVANYGTTTGSYPFNQICTVSGGIASCVLQGLTAGTTYFARVTATNGAGLSTSGVEGNQATSTATGEFFVASGGSGSPPCTSGSPCNISVLPSRTAPGRVLNLRNGTYTASAINLNCGGGGNATSGNSTSRVTIKAENERVPRITGVGDIFNIANCSWYRVEGLVVTSSPGAGCNATARFFVVTDTIIYRNIFAGNDPTSTGCGRHHLLGITDSSRVTIEENELYNVNNGHMMYVTNRGGGVGQHRIRRNYLNPKPFTSNSNGGGGIVLYPAQDTIVENNIQENAGFDVEADFGPQGRNKFFGNIVFNTNGYVFSECRGQTIAQMPTQNTWENLLIVGASGGIIFDLKGSNGDIVRNVSIINNTGIGISASMDSLCNTLSSSASVTITNTLAANNTGIGIQMTQISSSLSSLNETVSHTNGSGGTQNYSVGGYTNTNSSTSATNASLGNCPVFVPTTATALKGTGVGGADIGANILYKLIDGVPDTSVKLWTSANGKWNTSLLGAIATGFNDTGASIRNVEARLHPSCTAWPAGY